ncbi:MAG: S8 family serine peptidase, partial [Candidatus Omnitrophota bacterium]|nr:S8 family serine peptidase [Candidatus Omnitrophota bacterium]
MLKKIDKIALIFLISLFIFNSPQKSAFSDGKEAPSHLKYFGFYHVDSYIDDPYDSVNKTNYIDEVKSFTNIAHYIAASEIKEHLLSMARNNIKPLIDLHEILFVGASGFGFKLRPDYKERWNTFLSNADGLDLNSIAIFYLADEPTSHGISYDELKAAADLIKSTPATKLAPLMFVEAGGRFCNKVPESVDWVGFDQYGPYPTTDEYLAALQSLKDRRSRPDQKIVLVMDSQWTGTHQNLYTRNGEKEMGLIATAYYNLAKSDEDVIAILGFIWPGWGTGLKGARDLPQSVRDTYEQIGKMIIGDRVNRVPVAKAEADPVSGTAPLTVQFYGSESSDPDGDTLTYSWDFGDGITSADEKPSHKYMTAKEYTASLTVSDNKGAADSATVTITVTAASQPGFIPDELIVRFKPGARGEADVQKAVLSGSADNQQQNSIDLLKEKYGVKEMRRIFEGKTLAGKGRMAMAQAGAESSQASSSDLLDIYKIQLAPGADVFKAAQEFRNDPGVAYAEPNYICRIAMAPNDPYYSSTGSWGQGYDDLWGLKKIQCGNAWDASQGEGVVVAVIDTGVDYNHEDISQNIWVNTDEVPNNGIDDDGNGYIDDVRGWDFAGSDYHNLTQDNDPMDGNGHGTHAAGIIAATSNNKGIIGVAPKAKIMALKGLDDTHGEGSASGLANCLYYAADNGARIINTSWGISGVSQFITDVVNYIYDNMGCVIVASAGNSNQDINNLTPARIPVVITVSATSTDDGSPTFSNWGTGVDVASPGVEILSLRANGTDMYSGTEGYVPGSRIVGSKYYRANGTSMSAPHVSGLAALLLAYNPGLTNQEVNNVIKNSADDANAPGTDIYTGSGRINAEKAMQLCSEPNLGDSEISAVVKGDPLVIKTKSQFAGAISSLTWRGKEFIDTQDHGRELQSALFLNDKGEDYNPTEAGSSSDYNAPKSTSKCLDIHANGNSLYTKIQMAYWRAVNGVLLSNVIHEKQVTIGYEGIDNVIEYLVTYNLPEYYTSAHFEIVTGYMPPDFNAFYTYDPQIKKLSSHTTSSAGRNHDLPVILSTNDGKYAMGAYTAHCASLYSTWEFVYNTTKWNIAYYRKAVPAGAYPFRAYVVVGTLEDVKASIDKLYALERPSSFISQSAPSTMIAGQRHDVEIQIKNAGTVVWKKSEGFSLGSQNPENNQTWGIGRVELPKDEIAPGETAVFKFQVTAPSGPGIYNFQWRMLQEWVTWFGDWTPNLVIAVNQPPSTGVIQGYKVDNRGNYFNNPGATITVNGNSFGPSVNPYSVTLAAGTYTVTSSVPQGYSVGYTLCYNRIDGHSVAPTPGNSVRVDVPANGYADLWWHYTPPNQIPTASITSITPNPAALGEVISFTGQGSDTDGTITAYEWKIDGAIISSLISFTKMQPSPELNLAVGDHTVSFRAKDNNNAWS